MTSRKKAAEQCLVAVCAHLSLTIVRDENYVMWRNVIRDVLPDCDRCSEVMIPLRVSAETLVHSVGSDRGRSLARMRHEVHRYYAKAAANRFDVWKSMTSADVIE